MANDLLIKINADASDAKKEFDSLESKADSLESQLKKASLISGAAFAALTGEIYLSVKAFEESEKASRTLAQALQNQGIFTQQLVEDYKDYANAVQDATGVDNDAVTSAQTIVQSYLGQTKITKELTFAIADLAETMGGDLNSAATLIGKTIGTGTNALKRQGVTFSETATEAEKMAKVLEVVGQRAGGFAEKANEGLGGIRGLKSAFGDFQEQIGSRFAPIITLAINSLTSLFKTISNSPELTSLAAALLIVGTALAGFIFLAVSAPLAIAGFNIAVAGLTTVMTGLGVSMSVATGGLVLLSALVVSLALDWDKSMAILGATTSGFITFAVEAFAGLGKVLIGFVNFDYSKMKEGLEQVSLSFFKARQAATSTFEDITASQKEELAIQNTDLKEAADKTAAIKKGEAERVRGIARAEIELLKLQNASASAELIALKVREVEVLKALNQDKSQTELNLLREKRDQIIALQDEQLQEDIERAIAFDAIMKDVRAELEAEGQESSAALSEEKLAQLRSEVATSDDIDKKLIEDKTKRATAADNKFLEDKKKFGVVSATISRVLNTEEVTAATAAAGQLVALSQSKNKALAGIGKAAAITQIGIDTAKGAVAVYNNFQLAIPYPPVSIPLGIAAAGAIVAYGAEKIGQVTAAQDGGLIEGGVVGRDSVPALLEPGELVVPRRNFNDVVGAVQGGGSGNQEMIDLLRNIDSKFSNPQTTVIQGDVMADDSFVDAMVKRISDAVEFRNGQIFGVTT